MTDVDVHVPNTPTTRIVVGVATGIIGTAIIGTFAILWNMNEQLTMVYAQQINSEASFIAIRDDIKDIKKRLRELEHDQHRPIAERNGD